MMPRPDLVMAVAQPLCSACDVAVNAARHAAAVRAAAGARVVVFPELSLTGYELSAAMLSLDDPRLKPLVEACADTGTLALVGAPVDTHIAMLAVDGTGVTVAYRKVWLGEREARLFIPGPGPAVLEVDGWRLGLAICKDTGTPQHASETAALGMDVYVAGVVEDVVPDERARRVATEHDVWVAIASFAGSTGEGYDPAAGGSGIWAPDGVKVAQAGAGPGELACARLFKRDPIH